MMWLAYNFVDFGILLICAEKYQLDSMITNA